MLHPATRIAHINDSLGLGVVATERIPAGTITWVDDALEIRLSQQQVSRLHPLHLRLFEHFAYSDPDGRVTLNWDHARFVNHSCEPSCLSGPYKFEVAVRDIEPGEQLTDDYAALCLSEDFRCACGTPSCRGVLTPDDAKRLGPVWRRQVEAVLVHASDLSQPLLPLLDTESIRVIEALAGGNGAAAAVRHP